MNNESIIQNTLRVTLNFYNQMILIGLLIMAAGGLTLHFGKISQEMSITMGKDLPHWPFWAGAAIAGFGCVQVVAAMFLSLKAKKDAADFEEMAQVMRSKCS